MVFDPFKDFHEKGYLRNVKASKDPQEIKELEHISFISNLKNAPQKFTSSNNKTYWFKKSTLGTYNLTYGITSLQKLNYENGKFELTNKEPTQLQKDLLAAITYTNGTYRIDADAIDKTIEESKKQNQNKCK